MIAVSAIQAKNESNEVSRSKLKSCLLAKGFGWFGLLHFLMLKA